MYVRLEYSESAGHFHFSRLSETGENTNGYVTLAPKIKAEQAEAFGERIRQEFPTRNTGEVTGNLSLAEVQKEFQEYATQEIKIIRERMDNTYQSRSRIFRKT